MKQELREKLINKYSKAFTHSDELEISCHDGWYNLIERACGMTQQYLDWNNIKEEKICQIEFVQIKEKFGGLRLYYNGGDNYIRGVIDMAEGISYVTCEMCGNSGKSNLEERRNGENGCIKTRCVNHKDI